MPTTIKIQGTFPYGILPLIILFIVLISPLIKRMIDKKKAKKNSPVVDTQKPNIVSVPYTVKESYVDRLEKLMDEYRGGMRNTRDSYQLLSLFIRNFAKEYAGVDVTRKTLAEMRYSDVPRVAELIEEFYECEFAPQSSGDFVSTVKKTIRLINNWE